MRARSTLIQGLFPGAMGIGAHATTAYRVFVLNQPDAQPMGLFAIVTLVVDVVAAFVLSRIVQAMPICVRYMVVLAQ